MPVGTHGVVRGLHPDEVRRTGAQIVLGNTYHLHLRPGRGDRRGAGRHPPLHALGQADPHRLGRLPGVLARGTAGDHRGGRRPSAVMSTEACATSRPRRRRRSSGRWAAMSPWSSTMWCRARRRGNWPRKGWSARCAGWTGAWRATGNWRQKAAGARQGGRKPRADPLAHRSGRHPCGPAAALPGGNPGARTVDRCRGRRALRRRAEAGDAPGAGRPRADPAPRDAALSYGGRISSGSAGRNRPRRGPVRLRGGDAKRPPWHRLAADRDGSTSAAR